jgi:2-dehydro-3-deoxygluconokinase
MSASDGDRPEVVSLGEAMVELNALEPGPLRAVRRFEVGWGGDTSNFAIAVRRLGRTAGYVSRVGRDEFGASLLDLWHREGVDTTCVTDAEGEFTGAYFLSRHSPGEHGFTYFRQGSAASRITDRDLARDYLGGARVFHTSGITQGISQTACDAAFAAMRMARQAGLLVTYDPNYRPALWPLDRARATILHSLTLVDLAFPSLEDAALLTGEEDPAAAAVALQERGPRLVALKRGAEGVTIADGDVVRHVAGYAVDAVDPAGAGDTFSAAFVVGWLEGWDREACADFANAAAALTASGYGCVSPIPTRAQVDDLRREAPPVR